MPYKIVARHKKEELLKWHARAKKPIVCVLKSENESMLAGIHLHF